jgi:RHS repeat-associated protein
MSHIRASSEELDFRYCGFLSIWPVRPLQSAKFAVFLLFALGSLSRPGSAQIFTATVPDLSFTGTLQYESGGNTSVLNSQTAQLTGSFDFTLADPNPPYTPPQIVRSSLDLTVPAEGFSEILPPQGAGQEFPTVQFLYQSNPCDSASCILGQVNLHQPAGSTPITGPGTYPLASLANSAAGDSSWALAQVSSEPQYYWTYAGDLVSGSLIVSPTTIAKSLGAPCHVPGSLYCGDPITIGTGNLFERVTDYATTAPNLLDFTRYYNSLGSGSVFAAALGRNWRSTYDRYLHIISATAVYAERADGQIIDFTLSAGEWTTDSDLDLKLAQSGTTWTLTDQNDTLETYTEGGTGDEALLDSIRARNGYTQTLQYDANNQLIEVTDSYRRSLKFTYASGLLTSVSTPDGLVLTYGYAAKSGVNLLTSAGYSTNPATKRSYLYGDAVVPFALTGIIDENGDQFAAWTYDANGRVTRSEHAGGADLTTIAYDDTNGSRTLTNALGQQEVYKFATLQGVPKVTEIDRLASPTTADAKRLFSYDATGYLSATTDWNGNETDYVNNARGLPTSVTVAASTAQQRVTTIAWLANFHLPATIVAPELTTTFAYDANGDLVTTRATDATANTAPYATKGQTRTSHYTWANFLPTSATDPLGKTTQFQWGSDGALTAITNALGQKTQVTQHLPGGLPQTIVNPNGVTTTLAYNVRDWLRSSTVETAAGSLTTSFDYDYVGDLTEVDLPDGSALGNTYDAAHRLVAIADLLKNQVNYTLDPLGDRTATDLSANTTLAAKHSASFDALGRLLKDIGGVGQTTTYAYDANGNPTSATDLLGRVTAQAFDALDRLVRVADPAGGITTIGYDSQDQPVEVTDPNLNSTYYVYDGFGDLIEIRSPDTGDTVFYYDADGNLVKRVVLGIGAVADTVTNWTYDALDRVSTRSYPGDATENVFYVYDQPAAGFGIGRLTKVIDNAGALTRSYDERGNVLKETRSLGPASLTTAYAYDAASRIAAITYPSGWVALYTRDAMGRVTAVTAKPPLGAALPVAGSITYQPFGPVSGLAFGNGITERRVYDLDYRLTTISDVGAARTASYAYNAADDVLSAVDNVFGTQNFTYDALDRLSGAVGFYGAPQYRYDPVGNLLRITNGAAATSLVYAAHSNRLTEVKSGSTAVRQFAYSPAGNITSDQQSLTQIALGYNQDNRLASIKNQPNDGAAVSYDYFYDAFGQRLEKKELGSSGVETAYQYDLVGHLTEERELSGGASRTDYIYLGDRPIGMVSPGSTLAYYETGLIDTPQELTGGTRGVLWSADYQPFGQTKILVPDTQNLRFPGHYADAETGYYHNGFRDYDPTLGRYLESDPIGISGGLNTYAYADADPVTNSDPLGLQTLTTGVEYGESADGSTGYDEFSANGGAVSCVSSSSSGTTPDAVWPPLRALSDFSTGAGDVVSYGLQPLIREEFGSITAINQNSPWYGAGEWSGVGLDVFRGGATGWETGGVKAAGKEFSHWLPNRIVKKIIPILKTRSGDAARAFRNWSRSPWNGNYVSSARHYYHDAFRYPLGWRNLGEKWPWWLQQLDRIPNVHKGAAAGAAAGAAGLLNNNNN